MAGQQETDHAGADSNVGSVGGVTGANTMQHSSSDAKRMNAPLLQSPCFVHSYLDSGLGNIRKDTNYFDAQQFQSMPSMPALAMPISTQQQVPRVQQQQYDHARQTSSAAALSSDPPENNDDFGSSSSSSIAKARRPSTRPQPMHRGMQGAVEPDSDDDDGSGSELSSSAGTTSPEDSYLSTEEEETRVRSLTRQLAETAVGVREMSKQLGRARVKSTIQSVMIITKARDNHLIKLTREMAIWLMTTPRNGRSTGLTVYVDSQLRQSKRFDADGIRRDYPQIFANGYARSQNGANSETASIDSASQSGNVRTNSSNGQVRDDSLLRYWTSDMCSRSPHLFDFVVTLGGDGTVLFCSWLFQRIVPPVMPFALGSLGFLTNFDFQHYQKYLQSALDTGIRVNLRMRFTATVYRATFSSSHLMDKRRRRAIKSGKTGEIIMKSVREGGWESIETPLPLNSDLRGMPVQRSEHNEEEERRPIDEDAQRPKKKDKEIMCFSTRPVETFEVLNDLVVDRGPSPYVSLLEVFGDEHHLTTAQADGLCISTPTGSTAYSLSAGGSLVHPEIPAILISPICPHTLSFRPMLLPDSMELRIAVPYNSRSTAWASFDGRGRVELKQGDHIKVTASKYPFPTVCADNQSKDWFESISRTLKWNERQRQKSFVVVEEGEEEQTRPESATNQKERSHGKEAQSNNDSHRLKNGARDHERGVNEEEDEDDDDDDNEEEREEHFDIDDTSQAATRANTPDPARSGPSRRHSTTSDGRRHHHHHHHGGHTRSQGSSQPNSKNSSSASLSMFGLTPMTAMNRSDAGRPSAGYSQTSQSQPSSSTRVTFDPSFGPSSARSADSVGSGGVQYQHGVVHNTNRSLLDSPDRFGLAGPPASPQAISERHLATADFRLDDGDGQKDNIELNMKKSAEQGPSVSDAGQSKRKEDATTRAAGGEDDLQASIVHVAENKAKLASGANKLYRKLKSRSGQRRSSPSKGSTDGYKGGFELGRNDSRKSGGAALVVYGQDESDSDSTAEG